MLFSTFKVDFNQICNEHLQELQSTALYLLRLSYSDWPRQYQRPRPLSNHHHCPVLLIPPTLEQPLLMNPHLKYHSVQIVLCVRVQASLQRHEAPTQRLVFRSVGLTKPKRLNSVFQHLRATPAPPIRSTQPSIN